MSSDDTARFSALNDDIQAFRNYIRAERGLSDNTHLAYSRDMDRFLHWVAGGGVADYLAPTLRELSSYLEFLRQRGAGPSQHGPAPGVAADVLPLPAPGGAHHGRHGRSAQLAKPVVAHPAGAKPGRGDEAPRSPAGARSLLSARPGPAGDAVRHGHSSVGGGEPEAGRPAPGIVVPEMSRQRE